MNLLEKAWLKLKEAVALKKEPAVHIDNRGLIEEKPEPDDYVLGSSKEAVKLVIQENRDWTEFLPPIEIQKRPFETWACVSFSRNNCLEIMMRKLYGLNVDYSDRFLAKISGTVIGRGNGFKQVAQAGRRHGSVAESAYPWGGRNAKEYYQAIPKHVLEQAEEVLYNYEFEYEWIDWGGCNPEKLWEALQYSPLQVSVYAWPWKKGGVYQRTLNTPNHAVTLIKGEYRKYWYVFDHYEESIKKLAWNFYFGSAMRHTVKKKRMLELVKGTKSAAVYAIDAKQVAHHILDEAQFRVGTEAGLWGGFDDVRVISQTQMDKYTKGEPIVFATK